MSLPPGADPNTIPLAPNPNGSPPDFVNGPSLAPAITGIGVTLAVITTILVAVRINTNTRIERGFRADDAFCLIALVLAITYTGVMISMDNIDHHNWDLPIAAVLDPNYIKKNFVESILYGPMTFFAKTSILILYLFAFNPKRWLRIWIWAALPFFFVSYWLDFPATFVYCMPHGQQQWDLTVLESCAVMAKWGLAQGVTNIIADLMLIFLPLPIILKLHQSPKRKLAVAAIFGTAMFGFIASILTLYYRVLTVTSSDSSWVAAEVWICIEVEIFITIIVSCMPALSPFWYKIVVKTSIYTSVRSLLHTLRSGRDGSSGVGSGHFSGQRSQRFRQQTASVHTISPKGSEADSSQELRDTDGQAFEMGRLQENGDGKIVKTIMMENRSDERDGTETRRERYEVSTDIL